jgi:hypothetical protein
MKIDHFYLNFSTISNTNDSKPKTEDGRIKKMPGIMFAVVTGLLLISSFALAEDIPFSGFLGNKTVHDQLTLGPGGGVKLRWLKLGVDFKIYEKFMVDSVIICCIRRCIYLIEVYQPHQRKWLFRWP